MSNVPRNEDFPEDDPEGLEEEFDKDDMLDFDADDEPVKDDELLLTPLEEEEFDKDDMLDFDADDEPVIKDDGVNFYDPNEDINEEPTIDAEFVDPETERRITRKGWWQILVADPIRRTRRRAVATNERIKALAASAPPWGKDTDLIVSTNLQRKANFLICGQSGKTQIDETDYTTYFDEQIAEFREFAPGDADAEQLRSAMADFLPCVGTIMNLARNMADYGMVARAPENDDQVEKALDSTLLYVKKLIENYRNYIDPTYPEGNPSKVNSAFEQKKLEERLAWLADVLGNLTRTWFLRKSTAHYAGVLDARQMNIRQNNIRAVLKEIECVRWEMSRAKEGKWNKEEVEQKRVEANLTNRRELLSQSLENIAVVHQKKTVVAAIGAITLGTVIAINAIFGGDKNNDANTGNGNGNNPVPGIKAEGYEHQKAAEEAIKKFAEQQRQATEDSTENK